MKKLFIVFLLSICFGMISSFTISEESITTDCYVIADGDNAEVIYIPDNVNNEVCDESCFSVIE